MAQPTPTPQQAEALIARLEASRRDAGRELGELRRKLDVPARLRSSLASRPGVWMGGSLGAGFALSRVLKSLLRRPKKAAPSTGWMALLLGTLVAAAKPLLRDLALREVRRRFLPSSAPLPPSRRETRFPLSKP